MILLPDDLNSAPSSWQLLGIKLLHTAIWGIMAGSILLLPVAALTNRFDIAGGATVLILFECLVLMLNKGRCPLTAWAAQYTNDRADNFDIFLPEWLARHNKSIFGVLFFGGEIVVLWRLLLR